MHRLVLMLMFVLWGLSIILRFKLNAICQFVHAFIASVWRSIEAVPSKKAIAASDFIGILIQGAHRSMRGLTSEGELGTKLSTYHIFQRDSSF